MGVQNTILNIWHVIGTTQSLRTRTRPFGLIEHRLEQPRLASGGICLIAGVQTTLLLLIGRLDRLGKGNAIHLRAHDGSIISLFAYPSTIGLSTMGLLISKFIFRPKAILVRLSLEQSR